jgi:UDP-glucose 4-epimerase
VDVADVVRANLIAADAALAGPINIGWGRETSVLELLEALAEVSDRGPLPDPQFAPERPGEVSRSCLEVTRAREELGWEAHIGLHDGLRKVLATLG